MSEPVRRTSEIEEPTNLYIVHPLSAWIVPHCARAGITPNQVSLAGMGCGIAAGIAYHWYSHPAACILGFALMFSWHVLDGADGQLARLTNSFSELGKIIDGVCDYVTFTAVYVGLVLALREHHGGWIWAVAILSGLCHAVQSAAYELQRQEYNFCGLARKSAALPELHGPRQSSAAGLLHAAYTRVQLWAAGDTIEFLTKFAAALAARPECEADLRAQYRAAFAPGVKRASILSSNYRTLAIFLCAISGLPLLYFALEIFVGSFILIRLLAGQRQRHLVFLAGRANAAALCASAATGIMPPPASGRAASSP